MRSGFVTIEPKAYQKFPCVRQLTRMSFFIPRHLCITITKKTSPIYLQNIKNRKTLASWKFFNGTTVTTSLWTPEVTR
jgi:hypothetical protein